MKGLRPGEALRKAGHIGAGGGAFLLRPLGPLGSAALVVGGFLFVLLVLPRIGGRRLWRREEIRRGRAAGILLYPLAVLLLILVFPGRLEVAAAVWGILAFGDGTATLAGKSLGRRGLPWNPDKTWIGSLAYWVFGTSASTVLLVWTAPEHPVSFALGICAATSLLAAALETLPHRLDDNLGVPLISGLFLFCLLLTRGGWIELLSRAEPVDRPFRAAGVIAVLTLLAYGIRGVDRSGAAGGFLIASLVWLGLGWRGFLVLSVFFALGTASTRIGYRKKRGRGIAQERGGRRQLRHVLANGAVAAAAALFAATTEPSALFRLAFTGALATAMADTAASEIGKLFPGQPVLLPSSRRVRPGTRGAVSPGGTAAGIASALAVSAVAALVGLHPWRGLLPVVVAAFLAMTAESLAGPVLERRRWVDSEGLNFLATLLGALLAVALGSLT